MRYRTRAIRWPVLVAAGVLVAGSGTAYAVTSDKSHGSYRTVAATKGDVEQVLQTSGTVDAAHRADLEFATSGTVARVKVAVGDTVKAGQVVATLDTVALDAAVTKARASVARAVAQLAADEDAQAQAVSDASSSPQGSKPRGSAPTSPTGGSSSAATLAALKAQQDAVTQAQTAASAAIAAAKDALTAQTAACAAAYDSPAPASDEDGTARPDASGDDAACSAALTEVQARQDGVAAAQDALAKALSSLAATLSHALATLGSSSASSGARTAADSSSSGADVPTDNTSDAGGGTVTAARLAADQASIEQARADLVDARQQLRQAVLRSTRSGRVVAVDVARGDDVSAGDVAATVVGGTAVTIGTTVPESKINQVRVRQHVRVTTPGESSAAEGTVTAIGLVADNSSGTASYPVTVTVEDPTIALPAGSEAMLAIVVATAHDVVTVPTSAITRRGQGTDAFVQTWDGKTLSREAVTIGTVGARTVEVTRGLATGDRVVLADMDRAITGASDELNDRGGFGKAPVFRMDKGGAGGGPVAFKSGG